jgi:hypothetical protein
VPRQHVEGARRLGRQQHVAAQVEQPRHLVAPRDRLARPRLRERRQIAGNHRGDQERNQRDPVLRVGDGKGPDRWQEVEIERQHRHHGDANRDAKTADGGDAEHDEQQRQRDRGGAHAGNQPQQRRGGGNSRHPCGQRRAIRPA